MPPQLFGAIASSNSPALAAPAKRAGAQTSSLAFPGGYLAHDASARLFSDRGWLCVGQGEPRFADERLAQLARESGAEAAWLAAFERDGAKAPAGVKGRFSIVLINPAERQAWLATDRFGTWPLCYSILGGALRFANRADTVPLENRRISHQAVYEYLYFHMIPAPTTIFEGVERLSAGCSLHWKDGTHSLQAFAEARFDESRKPELEAAKQEFRDIVRAGVAREAEGHEVGAFLSGGTDSSTVAGMLCQVLGRPAKTYSMGFDAAGYDEMEYARIAAKHFGTDNQEYYVTPDDLLDGIPKVAVHYDQPFGNSSAVPAWVCANRARADGLDKLLAGDGGDELFGGNARYAKQRVFDVYRRVPGVLRKGLLEPAFGLRGMDRIPLLKKGASYIEQARVPLPERFEMYNMLERLGAEKVFAPDFLDTVDRDRIGRLQRETWDAVHADSLVNRMLGYEWKYTLADNDLPKVLGTTELAGLEVGFPLLSDELLEFSVGIPPEWKVKGMTLRWFFKEALRGFLPDEIIAKKKHGFGLPFGVWACQHEGLKALAHDALDGMRSRGIVRPEFIDELLGTLLPAHPGYYGEMVWILMMMEFWMRGHEAGSFVAPRGE